MSTLTPHHHALDVWQARHSEQVKLAGQQDERRTAWARYGVDAAERVEELDTMILLTQGRIAMLSDVLCTMQREGTS